MSGDFERVLVVVNEHSTGFDASRLQTTVTNPLQRRGISYEVVETRCPSTENPDVNRQLLKDELREGDLLVVCGGDGTVNQTANIVIDSNKSQTVTMAVAPFGRGNDIAYGLNGEGFDLETTLTSQMTRRQIGAMAIEATHGSEIFSSYAVAYLGLGLTGTLSDLVNQPDYRLRRETSSSMMLADITGLLPAILNARPFSYEQLGETKKAIELLFLNNERMALYFRFKKSIYDNDAMSHVRFKSVADLAKQLAFSKTNGLREEIVEQTDLQTHTALAIQFDGEVKILPEAATIKIWFIPSALGAIACRANR